MPASPSRHLDLPASVRFLRTLILAASLASGVLPSNAALIGTCTILVNSSGILTTNPGLTSLSSRNPGGSPANATIIMSGGGGILPSLLCSLDFLINCFSVSVTPPVGFTSSPAGAGTGVTFTSNFDVSGSFSLVSRVLLNGSYSFNFNMAATRSSGVFTAGSYQAQPTVRCE